MQGQGYLEHISSVLDIPVQGYVGKTIMEMAVPGRRKRGRPRKRWMDLARENMERLELRKETKSTGRSEKYFRAVVTPNREKPKEEEEEEEWHGFLALSNFKKHLVMSQEKRGVKIVLFHFLHQNISVELLSYTVNVEAISFAIG